ncbi:MAG: hypothetical protein K2Q09_10130 [Phycisphaerales bacterium]|nr:hypothetical protein [Phycisphaerales bacterium]
MTFYVIIAAIYPVFLWFMVFRFRRTWPGVALALSGTLLVWPAAEFARHAPGNSTGFALSRIVYGEMVLIGVVSAWLALMRRPPGYPVCPYCRYSLVGLATDAPRAVCPECGHLLHPERENPAEPFCLCCGQRLGGAAGMSRVPERCPSCGAGQEDYGNWVRADRVRRRAAERRGA